MKIAHISDIHWLALDGVRASDFLNKRWTGGLNLLAGRAKTHRHDVAEAALESLREEACDHLIVTGDLTNLAFEAEFVAVKQLLLKYYPFENLTIVPGNHDFYTRESARVRRFESIIYDRHPGDEAFRGESPWPFVQVRGDVAIIGLCSAQPRPWFIAAGRIGPGQLARLKDLLSDPRLASKFIIVALHHHLYQVVKTPGENMRHLDDRHELLEICQNHGVNMIVHGHNHDFTQYKDGDVIISECGSCSVEHSTKENRRGKFNIYDVSDGKLQSIRTFIYESTCKRFIRWQSVTPEDIPNAPDLR